MNDYESLKSDYLEAKAQYYKNKTRSSRDYVLLAIGRYQGYITAGTCTPEQSNDYFIERAAIDAIIRDRL